MSSYNCRPDCERRRIHPPPSQLPERPQKAARRPVERACRGLRPRCDEADLHEPFCGSFDYELHETAIQASRTELEYVEPRLGCVGEKLQRVTDDMHKFRELLTARRRKIEDLEANVHERIGKTEEQLICQVQKHQATVTTVSRTDLYQQSN